MVEGDNKEMSKNSSDIMANLRKFVNERILGASHVYFVEYLISHIALVLLVISGIMLFNNVVDDLLWEFNASDLVESIAILLVALPTFFVFYVRSRKAEREYAKLIMSRVRRRFVYLFASAASLTMLIYAIVFIYNSINTILNGDANVEGASWLTETIKQMFAIGFLSLHVYLITRNISTVDDDGSKQGGRRAVMVFAGISVLILVSSIMWPLATQRGRASDQRILDDFAVISGLVRDQYNDDRRLPDSFSDINKVPSDITMRAKTFDYQIDKETSTSYELCAKFKTDTTETGRSGGQDDFTALDFLSSSYPVGGLPGSDLTHKEGYDCIGYEVFGYSAIGDSTSASPVTKPDIDFEDFDFDSADLTEIEGFAEPLEL